MLRIDRALVQANTGPTTDVMTDRCAKARGPHLADAQRHVGGYLERADGRIDSLRPEGGNNVGMPSPGDLSSR